MEQQSLFKVESFSGAGAYEVSLVHKTCTCPAFKNKYAYSGGACKHLLKVAMGQGVNLDDIVPVKKEHKGSKWDIADLDPWDAYKVIERFSRQRLSKNFIMRDFLYLSEATHRWVGNYPEEDHDHVLDCGRELCVRVLEPILERFGRFAITYGYSNRKHMDWGLSESEAKKKYRSSNPHHWNRGTFGHQIYARVDIVPFCVVDGEVSRKEFGQWVMDTLDVDLLMQWEKSSAYCITISPKPRRVWLEWCKAGDGEGGSNKRTFRGTHYWEKVFPSLPPESRPKYYPSATGGKMWWS
jgi:hypothetical protein